MKAFDTKEIDGAARSFYELTCYDRADILDRLKARRKAQLAANLDAAGLEKEQRFAELEAFDERLFGELEFINYVNTAAGRHEVYVAALRPDCGEEADAVARKVRLPRAEEVRLIAGLCNLILNEPEAADADGGGAAAVPENPTAAGDVYGQPPTA